LPDPLYFATVWVVSLHGVMDGAYAYNVAQLDMSDGNAPVYRIQISKDFDDWQVETVQ
jgi:hypothetical protein